MMNELQANKRASSEAGTDAVMTQPSWARRPSSPEESDCTRMDTMPIKSLSSTVTESSIACGDRDVLNGRGLGVQRHPGNVKYRTLVHINKGIYAQCPKDDKIKISKGIVAAIRMLGGRFLERSGDSDERGEVYNDIGDKKAVEKTSQALREGQKKIREQQYEQETIHGRAVRAHPIEADAYFRYSYEVLEKLYLEEQLDSSEGGADPIQGLAQPIELPSRQVETQMVASSAKASNQPCHESGGSLPDQLELMNSHPLKTDSDAEELLEVDPEHKRESWRSVYSLMNRSILSLSMDHLDDMSIESGASSVEIDG